MKSSTPQRPRAARLPRAGRLAVVCAAGLTIAQAASAQANAARIAPVMNQTFGNYCGQGGGEGNNSCAVFFNLGALTPAEQLSALAQFAPDKFVAFSASSFGSTGAQFSVVGDRLSELRDDNLGAGLFGGGQTQSLDLLGGGKGGKAYSLRSADAQEGGGTPAVNGGGGGTAADAGQAAAPAGAIAPGALGLYARLHGQGDTSRPTSYDPGFRSLASGLTLGADYLVAPNVVLGASTSYDNSRSRLSAGPGGAGGGELRSRVAGLALYGAWYPTQASYVDATLTYGSSNYDSTRRIFIVGPPVDLIDTMTGSTSGHQSGASLGGGYNFLSGHTNCGPYARLTYSRSTISAFAELPTQSGSELTVNGQAASSLASTIGGQASYAVSQTWGVLVPNARLEWEHQYKQDRSRSIVAAFTADTTKTPAVIDTTPPDRNYFNLGLGLAAHFGVGRSAYIYYQAVLGKAAQTSNAVTAEVRLEF